MSYELPKAPQPTKSARSGTSRQDKKLTPDTPLQFLAGVGPKKAALFARKGIESLGDALYHFPFRFEDRRKLYGPAALRGVPEGTVVTVRGHIDDVREIPLRQRGRRMLEINVSGEDGGNLRCTWFNPHPGMQERLRRLDEVVLTGAVKVFRGQPQLTHPEVEDAAKGESLHWGRIVPIYSTTEGLTQRLWREVEFQALQRCLPQLEDDLPEYLRTKYELPELKSALASLHFPTEPIDLAPDAEGERSPSERRIIFGEFLQFQLYLLSGRRPQRKGQAPACKIHNRLATKIRTHLPFSLTNGQEEAIARILEELQRQTPMNRLIQGDVGCGKTLVALLTLAEAVENGLQGAFMAPTETLAEQHYRAAKQYCEPAGIRCGLLTGSLPAAEKRRVQQQIKNGELQLVLGTHALIQKAVQWHRLGYVVIDEQHRFGVKQRTALLQPNSQGMTPHFLTMTATPIPRSLALTVFGDLQVTTIGELPKARKPIATKVLPGEDRQKLYNLIHREVRRGRQCYLVYPLITESEVESRTDLRNVESETERLQAGPLKGLKLAMLHGRMPSEERRELMQRFQQGEIQVLISTTVIEVGVDNPNATVMAVENAERFGLSQLHQLRGRVGRGAHESFCVLITDIPAPESSSGQMAAFFSEATGESNLSWKRLRMLENSQDGFAIAEADLRLRGPGDFLGVKQSGAPTFHLGNLVRDRTMLEEARDAAEALLRDDPGLQNPDHHLLREAIDRRIELAGDALRSG